VTDNVLTALIYSTPGCIAAILGFLNNQLARRTAKHQEEQAQAMQLLEKNTNSMKDALVKVTGEAKFAEGLKIGQENK
jgi:hypothetical protein